MIHVMEAFEEAKAANIARAGGKPAVKAEKPGVQPRPTGKQLATANAFTMAPREDGSLDLRHASKSEPEGGRFLDMTRIILGGYARWPSAWSLNLAAIYVALTHFVDDDGEPLFDAIPHWLIVGPKGSGKTQGMKVMRALMRDTTIIATNYTMAGIRDALHAGKVPFLDELHKAFGVSGRANNPVKSIILGSYSAESGSLDGIGGYNPREAFGPMVLAAQPKLLTHLGEELDDLFERSVIVEWRKSFEDIPPLDDQFRELTSGVRMLLEVWGASERPIPTSGNPKPKLRNMHGIPDELKARAAEITDPLLAVADRAVDPAVVEENGNDIRWALIAREAVLAAFRGHGSNPSGIADDIEAKMKGMGLSISE